VVTLAYHPHHLPSSGKYTQLLCRAQNGARRGKKTRSGRAAQLACNAFRALGATLPKRLALSIQAPKKLCRYLIFERVVGSADSDAGTDATQSCAVVCHPRPLRPAPARALAPSHQFTPCSKSDLDLPGCDAFGDIGTLSRKRLLGWRFPFKLPKDGADTFFRTHRTAHPTSTDPSGRHGRLLLERFCGLDLPRLVPGGPVGFPRRARGLLSCQVFLRDSNCSTAVAHGRFVAPQITFFVTPPPPHAGLMRILGPRLHGRGLLRRPGRHPGSAVQGRLHCRVGNRGTEHLMQSDIWTDARTNRTVAQCDNPTEPCRLTAARRTQATACSPRSR
jgi:hypothetical protein